MTMNDLDEVNRLVNELQHCEGFERASIARQLQTHGAIIVNHLLPLLSHPYWAVRYWAAALLGEAHADLAIRELASQAANEQDTFVKKAMDHALASIKRSQLTIIVTPEHSPIAYDPPHDASNTDMRLQPPPYSRQQLGWHQFKRTESGDWILVLRPYYSRLFSSKYPIIMSLSNTGWRKSHTGENRYAYFKHLSEDDIEHIQQFIANYNQFVVIGLNDHIKPYFSNELDACMCLDFNIVEPGSADTQRTRMGELENLAKYYQDPAAIPILGDALGHALSWVPGSNMLDAATPRCLTYVPPEPSKVFHLPRELARYVAQQLTKAGSLQLFGQVVEATLAGDKASLKRATFEEKIAEWKRLTTGEEIRIQGPIQGRAVYLIDDLYQSGATMWTYAKYLKKMGARWVFGLVCVKSLRDTDNV